MTDSDYDAIIVQNTRVLMPSEYEKLRAAMITPDTQRIIDDALEAGNAYRANYHQRYQILCDAKLHCGMRDVEFRAMERTWYRAPRRVIVVPKGAHGKERSQSFSGRTVMLSLPGCDAIDRYLQSNIKLAEDATTQRDALRRYAAKAGISTKGITGKMFRKTIASWLMACFPEMEMYISASMGHSRSTLQKNYLGLGFPEYEVKKMKEVYLLEWGRRL
jgi:integrase